MKQNPSELVVRQLSHAEIEDVELHTVILPVSFQAAIEKMRQCLQTDVPYDYILYLGVATKRTWVSLEQRAVNIMHDGSREGSHDSPVVKNAPESYDTTLSLPSLMSCVSEMTDVPVRISDSAGSYVCNALFFATLHEVAVRHLPTKCGFIHLPPILYMDLQEMRKMIEQALRLLSTVYHCCPPRISARWFGS